MFFSWILLVLVVITGVFFVWARRRHKQGQTVGWWMQQGSDLFTVFLLVFLLRSFAYEPFRIPSGSMLPTLEIGDLILVNKYEYGLRLPIINTAISPTSMPQRGDVVVFRYPRDTSLDYIKRVVAVAGDQIDYIDKQMRINGVPVAQSQLPDYLVAHQDAYAKQFAAKLPVGAMPNAADQIKTHRILNDERDSLASPIWDFPFRQNCQYGIAGFSCKVPAGHVFVMGDNRDNSEDSRYWGFVPQELIVGHAVLVWMNFSHFSRIGTTGL